MSFRIQKRINLGKGLGLNISKSGISPSLRTKTGSISSKGYSVRTGVKGVNYRKAFSKNSGCVVMLLLFVLSTTYLIFFLK
ncbi:MAG: hypothetical protein CVU07_04575 [Bacteroidetes bacterium HGW-Bacteroidetes-23]|nr:MAG: hypothetical protein CVU07_04575 [Bacteroidetes bacterium HGW-Bacteroidetes-23]